jgi:hypothetical protein
MSCLSPQFIANIIVLIAIVAIIRLGCLRLR